MGNQTEIHDYTFRRITEFLRAHGWRTTKTNHALRALAGSLVAMRWDVRQASVFLRHASVTTTEAYTCTFWTRGSLTVTRSGSGGLATGHGKGTIQTDSSGPYKKGQPQKRAGPSALQVPRARAYAASRWPCGESSGAGCTKALGKRLAASLRMPGSKACFNSWASSEVPLRHWER